MLKGAVTIYLKGISATMNIMTQQPLTGKRMICNHQVVSSNLTFGSSLWNMGLQGELRADYDLGFAIEEMVRKKVGAFARTRGWGWWSAEEAKLWRVFLRGEVAAEPRGEGRGGRGGGRGGM
jgi:hypothetical protein